LFRLVYRLPELLPRLRVDPDALELLYSFVFRLVEYILANRERFLDPTRDYRMAQPAYLKRSDAFHEN
jgi:hypothetical protein